MAKKKLPNLPDHPRRVAWKTLARIYRAAKPGSIVRRVIAREARRCGYTLKTILDLHR